MITIVLPVHGGQELVSAANLFNGAGGIALAQ